MISILNDISLYEKIDYEMCVGKMCFLIIYFESEKPNQDGKELVWKY